MKTNFFKYAAFAAVAALAAVSCSKDDEAGNPGDTTKGDLIGTQTATTRTLEAGETYTLSGKYIVPNGKTLKIEEGVTLIALDDNVTDYILIQQGGMIDAQGTETDPIIMTSELKEHGAWGGLHICGKAQINAAGGTGVSEVGDSTYGGNDDNDNSGTLKWIRVEYAGYVINPGKEANGFTFYGVGSGTTLEYLHAYKGKDDGFEFFGGCANAKHLISTDNNDDSFDWTQGYRGTVQYAIANQLSRSCGRLMEGDNDDDNNTAEPQSYPTFANVTLIGKDSDKDDNQGARIRVGSKVKLLNVLISGKTTSLKVSEKESVDEFLAGITAGEIDGVYCSGAVDINDSTTGAVEANDYDSAVFASSPSMPTFSDVYVGTVDSSLLNIDYSKIDSKLVTAGEDYAGAIKSSDETWAAALYPAAE